MNVLKIASSLNDIIGFRNELPFCLWFFLKTAQLY